MYGQKYGTNLPNIKKDPEIPIEWKLRNHGMHIQWIGLKGKHLNRKPCFFYHQDMGGSGKNIIQFCDTWNDFGSWDV